MEPIVDFREMVENKPYVSMRLAYDGETWSTWYVSKNVEQFGYSREDLMSGRITWRDMIHPDDRVVAFTLAHDYVSRALDDFRLEYRIRKPSGESIHVTEFSHINRNPEGAVVCVDSVLINTSTGQVNKVIAENHFRQQAVLNDILLSLHDSDLSQSLQIILDKSGSYLNTSRALLFKDSPDHRTCKVVYEWLNAGITSVMDLDYAVTYSTEMPEIYVALQDTGILLVNAGEIPKNCQEEFEKEGLVSSAIFAVYLYGKHYGFVCFDDCVVHRTWDEDTANFLKNIANLISSVLLRMDTEEKLQAQEKEVKRLAYADHLTGLPNRFRCDEDLTRAIAESGLTGRHGYALFLDLDDFKIVNDCYGHDFGDGVLISFATFARDLFEKYGTVYRFGGDEFLIILNNCERVQVLWFVEQLLQRAQRPWSALGKEFYCSLSIGIVEYSAASDTPRSVVKKADIAMYSAKKSGKNNYAFYAEGLDNESLLRSEMEMQLRNAMQNDLSGFVVHYQPYSDTKSKKIIGAEALVRLKAADGSLLVPEQFLALAEYLGLIVPIGEFVLRKAAEQCKAINAMGGYSDFTVTVNMSQKELKRKDIVARTLDILEETGVNLRNIIISINETNALADYEKMVQVCREFKKSGIRTALNDFGSGSASFINLREIPVDIIKVSPKYVSDIDDHFTTSLLRLISELSHSSGKIVCMNGVERDSEYSNSKKVGVDWVQGFLLYRPGDANTLLDILSTRLTGVFFRKTSSHVGSL